MSCRIITHGYTNVGESAKVCIQCKRYLPQARCASSKHETVSASPTNTDFLLPRNSIPRSAAWRTRLQHGHPSPAIVGNVTCWRQSGHEFFLQTHKHARVFASIFTRIEIKASRASVALWNGCPCDIAVALWCVRHFSWALKSCWSFEGILLVIVNSTRSATNQT